MLAAGFAEWKVKNSSNGSLSTNLIGSVSSVIAPADCNGERQTDRYYDGNGREVKRGGRDFRTFPNSQSYWVERATTYYIRSSILGNEVVSEVNNQGSRIKGYVRAAGTTLATQTGSVDNEVVQ